MAIVAMVNVLEGMTIAEREQLNRHCDLYISSSLYHDLIKWDRSTKSFTRKGPFYNLEEMGDVCDAIVAILEEYFAEKHRGKTMWSGFLEWADWNDPPSWTVVDMQGGPLDEVWPESAHLKDGDTFEALIEEDGRRVWFQTTLRQEASGAWTLEGTDFITGDLDGLPVRQDVAVDLPGQNNTDAASAGH